MDPTINILSMPWLFTYSALVFCQVITNNPITPSSDQEGISPYNINTISSRQVMKNINWWIII